jgi:cell division protein FtsL
MNDQTMNKPEILMVLNHASRKELLGIPGIGPRLAERLMAARPFESLEAVKRVKGINQSLLDRLIDFASMSGVSPAGEPEPAAKSPAQSPLSEVERAIGEKAQEASERVAQFGEQTKGRLRAAQQALEILPNKSAGASSKGRLAWWILASSAASATIAIMLTLAILGVINGGLKFATASEVQAMQHDVVQLSSRADGLQQDVDGLRGRVGTLEGLGTRTVALEKAQQQMSADLQAAGDKVKTLQDEVTALEARVSQQDQRTLQFEGFLRDLQTLLNNLLAPQGGNP